MKPANNTAHDFSDLLKLIPNPHPLFRRLAEASTLDSFELTARKASPEELKGLKNWLAIQTQLAVRLKEHLDFVSAEVVEALSQKGIQMPETAPNEGKEKATEIAEAPSKKGVQNAESNAKEGLSPLEEITGVAGDLPNKEGSKNAETGATEGLSPLEQVIAEAAHSSSQPAARNAVLAK